MHLIDLMWGVLAIVGVAIPAYRLYDNMHRPGAPYLLSLVAVCAAYPWAYIVYPHTLFDQGLVFAFTAWIGPLYLLSVFCYLNILPRGWPWIRNLTLLITGCLSVFAIMNPLHGQFATFSAITPAEPLTTTGQVAHGVGMTTMGGFSIACIVGSVILIGFFYNRSRFHLSHLVTLTLFPVAAGLAYLLQDDVKRLVPDGVNTFILCTTLGLGVLSYSLLRSRFLELRPIARELVLNLIPDAMAIIGDNGIVIDCNTHFADLLNRSVAETIGIEIGGQLPESAWVLGNDFKATRSMQLDKNNAVDDPRFFEAHLVRLDPRGRHRDILVLLRNTTEQTLAHKELQKSQVELQTLNKELARLSNTDALTGLPNRRHFLDQLNQEYERAARLDSNFALLSIDLDDFKSINDNHGHSTGDQALVNTARAMERQCRAVDTLARVGGEEFMVMLLDIGEQELTMVAERFRQAIERAIVPLTGNERLSLTASIGGAMIHPHIDIQTAMRQVDDALYEAKRTGRNRVVIPPAATPGQRSQTSTSV